MCLSVFLSGEKVEGQRVHLAEGLTLKGSSQQSGPLVLSLRKGGPIIFRIIPLTTGVG